MLAVITDDLTGAAEIAGIALAKGVSATIEIRSVHPTCSDILVLATNTRSLDVEAAATKTFSLTADLKALTPEMIFKKVDSVLRGHVGPEIDAQMQAEGKSRALLVPANPSLGRTIVDSVYYLSGVPIALTGFGSSINTGAPTSKVDEIITARGGNISACLSIDDYVQQEGLVIGNAATEADIAEWATRVNGDLVPAGAADFFKAILDRHFPNAEGGLPVLTPIGQRSLYICGSNFPSSVAAVNAARNNGYAVLELPDAIYHNHDHDPAELDAWADRVCAAIAYHGTVIVTALQTPSETSLNGQQLTKVFAWVTERVVEELLIDELLIEGGATAEAVMQCLGIDCLEPVQSLATGVTRMCAKGRGGLHITMKPGSYLWPEAVWPFNKKIKTKIKTEKKTKITAKMGEST